MPFANKTKLGKTIAIIQARMGSSRLPGKMLERIEGEPLLYHIISRAQQIRCTDDIYLATTDQPVDDHLAEIGRNMGIKVVRGSEKNVMERFFLAIDDAKANYIIRICGDAPLFDPDFVDQTTRAIVEQEADCIQVTCKGPTAYQGAGAISCRALKWSQTVAPHDPLTYEHVTAYAYANLEQLKTVPFDIHRLFLGEFKLSIDTIKDLEFIRTIYAHLYKPGHIVPLKQALLYLKILEKNFSDC